MVNHNYTTYHLYKIHNGKTKIEKLNQSSDQSKRLFPSHYHRLKLSSRADPGFQVGGEWALNLDGRSPRVPQHNGTTWGGGVAGYWLCRCSLLRGICRANLCFITSHSTPSQGLGAFLGGGGGGGGEGACAGCAPPPLPPWIRLWSSFTCMY